MAMITKLWLATETKTEDDADTDAGRLNVTINVDGEDLLDSDFGFMSGSGPLSGGLSPDRAWLDRGQVGLSDLALPSPIDSNLLTNSSIRLGVRSDDAWAPKQVLLLGATERQVIALAMETDIGHWLSTDRSEGKLTMPLRLVGTGNSSTVIRRVILLTHTKGETDNAPQLQITAGGTLVLQQAIYDTDQDDLEEYSCNWYPFVPLFPFTRGDVLSNGGMQISILGSDAWGPRSLFVYGLDTAAGRPNEVVHLVSISEWTLGKVTAQPTVLPVI